MRWLIFFAGFLSFQAGMAGDTAATVPADTAAWVLREFDAAALHAYKGNPDFQYGGAELVDGSWWLRFRAWLRDIFGRSYDEDAAARATEWVVLMLGAAALVFLIFRLLGMDVTMVLKRKAKKTGPAISDNLDDIHEIDFDDGLTAAIGKADFRAAVRLLYLRSLKILSDRSVIAWRPGKTNAAYVGEIADQELKGRFRRLTHQFEYIWYGDFKISSGYFEGLHRDFSDFNERLNEGF